MIRRVFRRLFWGLFTIFIGVHLYAISLKFIPVVGTILMVQRQAQGETIKRNWTRIEDISPYVVQAVMGGEDSRFCDHNGIDWGAIEQAIEDNAEGGKRRGGSTITQQTAKNVFFWNGGGYVRKAGEAWFAIFIDFVWGKTRVMEVYLNVAEWGDGIFGIEAAAQERFGKSASNLNAQEAALLSAVLPSPNKWRVDPPGQYVKGRAGILRQRMRVVNDSGYAACIKGAKAAKPEPDIKEETPKSEISEPGIPEPENIDIETLEPAQKPHPKSLPHPAPESEAENAVIDLGDPDAEVEKPAPIERPE